MELAYTIYGLNFERGFCTTGAIAAFDECILRGVSSRASQKSRLENKLGKVFAKSDTSLSKPSAGEGILFGAEVVIIYACSIYALKSDGWYTTSLLSKLTYGK